MPEAVHLRVGRPVGGVGGGDAHVAGFVDVLLQLLPAAARDAAQVDADVLGVGWVGGRMGLSVAPEQTLSSWDELAWGEAAASRPSLWTVSTCLQEALHRTAHLPAR